jgi:hypothetical protein
MFKSCVKGGDFFKKTCVNFCMKWWVTFQNNYVVGKVNKFFTFLPTYFLQLISTHKPLLITNISPLSTTPITTIKYIIRKEQK